MSKYLTSPGTALSVTSVLEHFLIRGPTAEFHLQLETECFHTGFFFSLLPHYIYVQYIYKKIKILCRRGWKPKRLMKNTSPVANNEQTTRFQDYVVI